MLSLRAEVSANEDGGYEGPAQLRSLFVLPDGTKISANSKGFYYAGSGDVGLARTLVINDQSIPIIRKELEDGTKIWVTEGASYTLSTGQTITLNVVWHFHLEIEGVTAGH